MILFGVLKALHGLRVSEEEELAGLDIPEHGAPGYGEGFGSFVPEFPATKGATTPTVGSVEEPVTT
jgi:hypothetical protein